jgi:hypothetical protein
VTPGVIDQDAPHDLRRHAKEVRPILPIALSLVDEPQIDLVDERGRLERVVHSFHPELPVGDATELRIDPGQ